MKKNPGAFQALFDQYGDIANAVAEDATDGEAKRAALKAATTGLDSLQDAAHLHSLITVVDCASFLEHLQSIRNLQELGMASMPDA